MQTKSLSIGALNGDVEHRANGVFTGFGKHGSEN
jgi:hypothetical protein